MKTTPEQEKFFKVLKTQERTWGEAEKKLLLGWAENDNGRIPFTLPEMPVNPVDVINWGKPRDKQRWEREETPACWTGEYLHEQSQNYMISTGKAGKKFADPDFWRNPENITDEQYRYAAREWSRRLNGVWIMIAGEPTYLTGQHYFYLQHFKIDNGYPQYRDRDRRWFYAWQACVDDPFCMGMVYLKHRRDGATFRCSAIGLEIVTRGDVDGKHMGITSKGKEDAEEVFDGKIMNPFRELVPFFSPMVASNRTAMKTELEFNDPPVTNVDKHRPRIRGIKGWIKYAAKTKKGKFFFDGQKLHFSLNDEAGKREGESIMELLRLLRPCLRIDGKLGKMLWPSTNEELTSENRDEFQQLWNESDPSLRLMNESRSTTSKMMRYFTPAYDGFEEQWFGPFGESIIHAPTQEQQDYLISKGFGEYKEFWDKGYGAYEYCTMVINESSNPIGERRQIPFTPEDSFRPSSDGCKFNRAKLDHLRDQLCSMAIRDGKVIPLRDLLTVRGRLEWTAGLCSEVYFVEDPSGAFVFNRAYLPGNERAVKLRIEANRIGRDDYGVFPMTGSRIVVGFDPQKSDREDSTSHDSGLSRAGGHGFIPYDPTVDHGVWDEGDPEFAKDFISNAFVFEFFELPETSFGAAENMLKACMFLNAKFHSERNVSTAIQVFKNLGAARYILYDQRLNGVNSATKKVVAGQQASERSHEMGDGMIRDFVQFFAWPDKMPFITTCDQWIKYNGRNNGSLDLKVSSEYTLMGAIPTGTYVHKTAEALRRKGPEKKQTREEWARSVAPLTSGIRF